MCKIYKNLSLEDIPGEKWKNILEYEGVYMVSNYGRVKSIKTTKRILKQHLDRNGYPTLSLWKEGKMATVRVHRLVATAFIPNKENKDYVDHIDTDKTNNCVNNLKWCTHYENMNNPITKENICRTHKESIKKASNALKVKVYCITTGKSFNSVKEAAEYYNISKSHIGCVCSGKRNYAGKLSTGEKLKWKYI